MKTLLAVVLAAAVLPVATAQAAGPVSGGTDTSATGLLHLVGDGPRRESTGNCRPYNGPFGYYGNPYCERGFDRDGKAGGYEIDLTRYFDSRFYSDDRRDRRRWR